MRGNPGKCKKIICLLSVLYLKLNGVDINLFDFLIKQEQYEKTSLSDFLPIPIAITEDTCSVNDTISVIAYIGSY